MLPNTVWYAKICAGITESYGYAIIYAINFMINNFNCDILESFSLTLDNLSAENSPLHDIVLQSAPGSPGSYPIVHTENQTVDGK